MLPMRILTVQEVRTLSGLENILTTERHGATILTVHWSLVTLFTVSMFWSLLAILIQTFKDFRGETRCCKLMLKELVLMERSWHRETPVVLKVCVCWQESFLCVQGQKRLSSALSFWQRRTRRLQVLPRWVTSYVRSTLDCQGFARWLKLCLQLCPELDLKCKQVTWPSCFCVRCHMMFVQHFACSRWCLYWLSHCCVAFWDAATHVCWAEWPIFIRCTRCACTGRCWDRWRVVGIRSGRLRQFWVCPGRRSWWSMGMGRRCAGLDQCYCCDRKGKSQHHCEVSLVRTSWAHGQAVQGRYEQGEVFSLLQVWSHWCAMPRQAQRFNRETAKEAPAESWEEQR